MDGDKTNILDAFFFARNAYEQLLICYYASEDKASKHHYDKGIAHIQRLANALGYNLVKRETE